MNTGSNKLGYIRRGFTLIELVVVVLILGILAAVALPKFVNQTDTAKTNGAQQTLAVLRTAIETYRVNNTSYPTVAQLPTAAGIMPYLRSPTFPTPGVGTNATNNTVVAATASPPTYVAGAAGWVYNATSGEIAINSNDAVINY